MLSATDAVKNGQVLVVYCCLLRTVGFFIFTIPDYKSTMKKLFYLSLVAVVLYEVLNVYFIMPMPGSQDMNSVELAYFFYSSRWIFRCFFVVGILLGTKSVVAAPRKWIPFLSLLLAGVIIYQFNFVLTADKMFLHVKQLDMRGQSDNTVPFERLIVGVEQNGEAKGYPIEFLAYHHQVIDSVGGKPLMITYCSVCRTGRVYEPYVNGNYETFRLVGMDHFNAMFEDASTGSWWRQSNGEAVCGVMKGKSLREYKSEQTTVAKWLEMYPDAKIMQADKNFMDVYDSLARYEQGKSKGNLTGTDFSSWKRKSWVLGIDHNGLSRAYDWNYFSKVGVINDTLSSTPIVLVLSSDRKSFAAFERPNAEACVVRNDSIVCISGTYDILGRSNNPLMPRLVKVKAYQEFWHSWQTFHPNSSQYKK